MSTQTQTTPPPVGARPGEGNANGNRTNSTTTCTVGCKLPSGFLMEMGSETDGNYRAIKLNGLNSRNIMNGFAITRGVPVDYFDAWAKKMKGYKVIKNALIVKVDGRDDKSLAAITKELKGQRTKLEPLNANKLPKSIKAVPAGGESKDDGDDDFGIE